MGRTFSVSLKKVKSKNQQGYHWVRKRKFKKRRAISRLKLTKDIKYTLRSNYSRALEK